MRSNNLLSGAYSNRRIVMDDVDVTLVMVSPSGYKVIQAMPKWQAERLIDAEGYVTDENGFRWWSWIEE